LQIKATFLGAHAFPELFKTNHRGYLDLIINEMLPRIADEGLADFMDVFCETNYFSPAEMEELLEAGQRYNLPAKVHVNQFNVLGGVAAAVKHQARSVDHLELMSEEDFAALKGSSTMPVALPSCSFFLNLPYTPGREIIQRGLPLALATDCNPGSSPSGKMSFVVALACINMKLLPEEAINAATINGAYAMMLEQEMGSITVGKRGNVFITKPIPSIAYLPYAFGSDLVESVIINGALC
jgi:imidazolonepropionase